MDIKIFDYEVLTTFFLTKMSFDSSYCGFFSLILVCDSHTDAINIDVDFEAKMSNIL